MPGLYLAAILVSTAGIGTIDARYRLAAFAAPVRTAVAVMAGTLFFLAWDLVGIATGVFVKGDSSLYVGVDLAPQLPLEEPVFLAFLCYLALVVHGAARRVADAREASRVARSGEEAG
ncbi:lycopene cyclase domain-containing protein [Microbacter sp. GSS18]|nr:lycopene cyclase domain-containing protein [Microbacter sp. GSS18]